MKCRPRRPLLVLSRSIALGVLVGATAVGYAADIAPLSGSSVAGTNAYAEWITAIADSERALLQWPRLYLRLGQSSLATREVTAAGIGVLDADQERGEYQIGVQYGLVDTYKGVLVSRLAAAMAERYGAEEIMSLALRHQDAIGRRPALRAESKNIQPALAKADEVVAGLSRQFKANLVTFDELYACHLKRDALYQMDAEITADLSLPDPLSDALGITIDDLVRQYAVSDRRVKEMESMLRKASAWAFNVNGGYMQSLQTTEHNDHGFYVEFVASVSFGAILQHPAERRAMDAYQRWEEKAMTSFNGQVDELSVKMSATLTNEEARLKSTEQLLQTLDERIKALEEVGSMSSSRYRDALWLDRARLDANRVYLVEHILVLRRLLRIPAGLP